MAKTAEWKLAADTRAGFGELRESPNEPPSPRAWTDLAVRGAYLTVLDPEPGTRSG